MLVSMRRYLHRTLLAEPLAFALVLAYAPLAASGHASAQGWHAQGISHAQATPVAHSHLLPGNDGQVAALPRLRLIVETDAGGDPDDEQSLVRFLLYCNEWDVEGIIAVRPRAREGENLNPERTGLGIVRRLVKAYAACYANLVRHDPRYLAPDTLLDRTVPGYDDAEDGVKLVIAAVDAPDPRPVWFLNWGTDHGAATSCLKRALDQVLAERGPEGYAAFKARLRLSSDDRFGEHTARIDPPFPLWIDTFRPPLDGVRWYHRFSGITATAGGFDVRRHVLTGHGPLGELYPTNTTHPQKEGDTMTFLYLVPTGMNDPEQPTWGSWAGRYGLREEHPGRPYYWANQSDSWQGSTHRDNTLRRWAADLQNDFRARLEWCVQPPEKANHPPVPALDGDRGRGILQVVAPPGSDLVLDATASTDPDGDMLDYQWLVYGEAGTYPGEVKLSDPTKPRAVLHVPGDAAGNAIHVLLTLRDRGTPPLARYRRVVVKVGK